MPLLNKLRDNTIGSPVFVSLAIAIFFGNVCGYLATRHRAADAPLPCAVDNTEVTAR